MRSDARGRYVSAKSGEAGDKEMDDDGGTGKGAIGIKPRKQGVLRPFFVLVIILVLATGASWLLMNEDGMGFLTGPKGEEVQKSKSDLKLYQHFTLPNGLAVLAISDPSADRAAASMDVSVGSFSDPASFPGLAHFLEHMLFMGSEKYPDENQYSAFLSQHGGRSNAYTAAENTNYHFDITPQHLDEALDIFAQFFVAPLLREGSTAREVKAVENEHAKNLQSDGWRAMQLQKSLSNPAHPLHKFSTGNLNTLCGNANVTGTMETHCHLTRKALHAFYKTHYNAKRMKLVVHSTAPLAHIEAQVRGSFAHVPTHGNVHPPIWSFPVRPPGSKARFIKYVPIREQRLLTISWNLPPLYRHFKYKVASYISHLVGHESKGSLAALLKRRGLIESLSAGAQTDQRYGTSFEVSMSLTKQGLDSLSQVLDLFFQYLKVLRDAGALEWVWQESADLSALHFRFQEKRDPSSVVVNFAGNLQLYPPKYVISAPYTYETFDPAMIGKVMGLLTPGKADILVASKDYTGQVNAKEAIYGTPYSVSAVDAETIRRWENSKTDPELYLVKPNAFVPHDLSLFKPDLQAVRLGKEATPKKLIEKSGVRLWFKQDVEFKGKNWPVKPRVNVIFQITSPTADVTARASVLSSLFAMLYTDSLVETTYDAGAAGLSWSMAPSGDGIRLSVAGYHDKVLELLNTVTKPLVACLKANRQCDWANQQRYLSIRDELKRGLENSHKSPPYTRAMQRVSQLLEKRVWSVDRLLYELSLPDLTLDAVASHARVLFDRVFIEGFVHGNADEAFARKAMDTLMVNLGSFPLPETDRDLQQIAKITRGFAYAEAHTNPEDPNHALELYFQYPEVGIKWDVRSALFGAMAAEPCFDQLRTKEQLGYIVSCRSRPLSGSFPPTVAGFAVLVQSSFKEPPALEASARSFLQGFVANMTAMPSKTFQAHKTSLLAMIEEKETSVAEETSRLWKEILVKRYQWNRQKLLIDALKPITLADLTTFAQTISQVDRRSLSVGIYGQGKDPPRDLLAPDDRRERIWSMASFKGLPPPYWTLDLPTSSPPSDPSKPSDSKPKAKASNRS